MKRRAKLLIGAGSVALLLGGLYSVKHLHTPEARQIRNPHPPSFLHDDQPISLPVTIAAPKPEKSKLRRSGLSAYAQMQGQQDLLTLYQQLSSSKKFVDLEVAKRILAECQQISALSNVYRRVADGSEQKVGNTPVNESQKAAARVIVSRCAGFNGWQPGTFKNEASIITLKEFDALGADSQTLKTLSRREVPTDQMLRTSLLEHDPYVVASLQDVLLEKWFSASGAARSAENEQLVSVGFRQVQCAMGADCSEESLLALTGCFFNGNFCGLSYSDQVTASLSPVDATKAEDFRIQFVGAIQQKQFSIFGL